MTAASGADGDVAVLVAAADAAVVAVTGPDRIAYLDDVTTQRFADHPSGSLLGALVLDGKGVPLAVLWGLVDDERVLLVGDAASVQHVLDVVATRTFLAQVSFEPLDLEVVEATASGDEALAQRVASGFGVVPGVGTWVSADEAIVARHPVGLLVLGASADQVVDRLAGTLVDQAEVAVAAGLPRFGHEVVAGRLPEEYGLLATHVHLGKGCYPGQEPIAHMWMLGRPRRRLATLRLAADRDAGDDGDGVELTTVGTTPGHDGRVPALGFVAPATAPGDHLDDGVEVIGFVGDGAEVVGWTPAQTRRRDRDGRPDLPRRAP